MTTVTFYSNTKYAGGRSHRNINTLEFVEDKDILQAAEHYGYDLYPLKGEDFENGINDWNGNQVMDSAEFKKFTETGIGSIDLGETIFSTCELKDISIDEFKVLPKRIQLEYINIWYTDVDDELFSEVIERYGIEYAFEFDEKQWKEVKEI